MDEQARQIHIQSVKSVFHKVLWLVAGAAVVICLPLAFRSCGHEDAKDKAMADTLYVYDTIRYSRLELDPLTTRLSVPKVGLPEMVFIREDSTTLVYKDSIRYVTAPRQYYLTSTDEVDIWHSGIDSRIDSLTFTRRNLVITETMEDRPARHSITAYGETGYMEGLSVKAGIRYMHHPAKWMGIGVSIERDFAMKQTGIYGNMELTIGWN